MATLIQKYVKYPNDYLMNTMLDDTENKESVKSICKFLEEDLGLVQTSDTGQLDHNNIQSINVKDVYDKSTTARASAPFRYGYKVYNIEDTNGMDPLYLKLTFGLQDMSFNAIARSYTTLVIELELYGSTNGAGLYGGAGINQYYKTCNTNVPTMSSQVDLSRSHYSIISDSYGFYDKSNGRLFICLFPYSRSAYYTQINGPSLRFGIYLEKVTDNSVIDNVLYNTNFLLMTNTFAETITSYQRTSLLYFNQKYGYTASSTSFDYKPANYNYNYFNTNTVSKSMIISPITQIVTYTDTILFCDKFLVRPFTVIKVKDKNNLETDYFAMTCDALNSYASNTNNAWLIKI